MWKSLYGEESEASDLKTFAELLINTATIWIYALMAIFIARL